MSDSAENIKNTVPTTPKYTTTNKALLERLKIVENASKAGMPMSEPQESEEGVEIGTVKVELLAEGGYNYLWLVSYTSKCQAR